MKPDRITAFTDGVIAIIITIMVLELPVPKSADFAALRQVWPLFAAYALAFTNVAIFWVNHHHMMHSARKVSGEVLWANNFLLFWLSLVPFVIRWVGEDGFERWPIAAYGAVLSMAGLGYSWIEYALIRAEGPESLVKKAVGANLKGHASLTLYMAAIPVALFVSPMAAVGIYIAVALLWLVPDRRFERL